MQRIALIAAVAALLVGTNALAEPPPSAADQQLQAAVAQLKAQQTAIAENQAKIEAKLATINEAVRVARIYSSRSGH